MIRAGGAVLWRRRGDGVQIAVIHRPRRRDWSLPKGKLHDGEDELAAAVREVAEETGQRARPGPFLAETRYTVSHRGVEEDKVVRYWAMEALGGDFQPNHEVDEVRWLEPAAAEVLLTYGRDREVLARFTGPAGGGAAGGA